MSLLTPDGGDNCIMANAPVQRAALTLRAAAWINLNRDAKHD
jgi:hypothetical protein